MIFYTKREVNWPQNNLSILVVQSIHFSADGPSGYKIAIDDNAA